MDSLYEQTLHSDISISGKGLFTGEKTSIRLCPAEAGTGILFQRVDLPQKPVIEANVQNVTEAYRCTCLHHGETSILTVEHILSALSAFQIDNLLIEVAGPEIPVGDGSAKIFVEALEKAKIQKQSSKKKVYTLDHPVSLRQESTVLFAIPSDDYEISYTLHYPHSKFLRSQYYSFLVDKTNYVQEIAPCRTFSLYEDIAPMLEKGLLKEASLENGVVIKNDEVLNPEGIRFPDEMVRHKILDLMGDISLIGKSFRAHIIAIRSGHATNVAFGKKLLQHFSRSQ